jgi:hypothetical protein
MPQGEMESNLNPRSLGEPASQPQSAAESAASAEAVPKTTVQDGQPVNDGGHVREEEECLHSRPHGSKADQELTRSLVDLAIRDVVRRWHEYTLEKLTCYGKRPLGERGEDVPTPADAKHLDYWNRKEKDADTSARELHDRLRELTSSDPDIRKAIRRSAIGNRSKVVEMCANAMCVVIVAKRVQEQRRFVPTPGEEGILVRAAENSIVPHFKKLPMAWRCLARNTDEDLIQVCIQALMDAPMENFHYFSVRQAIEYFAKRIFIRIKQDQGLDEGVQMETDAQTDSGKFPGSPLEEISIQTGPVTWSWRHYELWLSMNAVFEPADAIRFWVFGNLRELGFEWKEIADSLVKGVTESLADLPLPPGVTQQQVLAACTSWTLNAEAIRQRMCRLRRDWTKHQRQA